MELDELKKMRDTVASAARDVENTIQTEASDFKQTWAEAPDTAAFASLPQPPQYRHPRKNWRLKQGATPRWYKARTGVRSKALSGAARVARFRPYKID
jgi:sec-independent protein translocase protein TatB